jgi:two-component system OmpR family sensor kinase
MSLRARLLTAMAIIAMLLVTAAVIVTRITRADLVERLDEQLIGAASAPEQFLEPGPGGADSPASLLYAAIIDPETGEAHVISYSNLYGDSSRQPDLDAVLDEAGGKPFTVPADGEGSDFRGVVRPLRSGDVVLVARPLDDVEASMSRLIRAEIVATVAILAILALVSWWVLRLGVRPIKQMTASAVAIAGGDLSERVPMAPAGTEAGELGVALNQMLDQIEESFATKERSEKQLRQFVADASHELRTPVATMRGYAELYRSGGLAERERLDDAMRRSEQEATRMSHLVDDLLLLARLDQGRPLEKVPVRLDRIADDVVRDARVREPERSITFSTSGEVIVVGDEARLRQVLTNLVGNALVHTPASAAVGVTVAQADGEAVVTVSDEGPGMDPVVAQRVFERFYRADTARSRASGGTGLGLSIVDAIVQAHGGRIAVASTAGTGTSFTVRLSA